MALVLAALCGVAFLGSTIRPDRALLPYPPEILQPQRNAAERDGIDVEARARGNLSMGDKFNQSLAWDRITQDRLRSGSVPTWTRDLAGGAPFVPQMGQVYHPFNLLLLAVPSTGIYGIWWFLHLLVLGGTAYRFLRRLEVSHGAALFGMVSLLLGLWTQARIHHNVMLSAVLPVFAMLSCTHQLFRHGGGLGTTILLALCTGLAWLTGFAPGSLTITYLVCAFAVLLCATAPRQHRLRPLVRFGVGVGVGLGLAAAQLLPVLLAAQETSRNPATLPQLAHFALEPIHLLTSIWPTLFSWPADHFYPGLRVHNPWPALAFLDKEMFEAGFNYPETAFYAGLAPLAFAIAALRDRRAWFFAGATAFGLAMAFGLLLRVSQFLPGAHSGDVKRFLLLFGLCVPVLAAIGFDRVLRDDEPRRRPVLATWGGALLALFTLASAALFVAHLGLDLMSFYGSRAEARLQLPPGTMAEWIRGYPGEEAHNRSHLLQLFGIAAAVGAAAWAALRWRGATVPILCVVTAAELCWHGAGPVVAVDAARLQTPPALLKPVLASADEDENGVRPRLQRLLPPAETDKFQVPVWPNMAAFWGAEDLATYNPLPKRRMEEFFLALEPPSADPHLPTVALGGAGVSGLRRRESLTHPLADLIGIEWILTSLELETSPAIQERTPTNAAPGYRLYRRTTCLPRATFLTTALIREDRDARLQLLGSREHDPRTAVVLEDPTAPQPDPAPENQPATVTIEAHADESVRIRVHNLHAGYLRLADPYDAGWRATTDGQATPIYVADHYLRAVFLPPGEHVVEFRYDGIQVRGPQALSLTIALLLLVLAVFASVQTLRRRTTPSRPTAKQP